MGVRIELEEGESIEDALRRFRKLIYAEGAFPLLHCKWHKKRHDFYLKPSILNRRRRWVIRANKSHGGARYPDPDQWWVDDALTRPRRSWGPATGFIIT